MKKIKFLKFIFNNFAKKIPFIILINYYISFLSASSSSSFQSSSPPRFHLSDVINMLDHESSLPSNALNPKKNLKNMKQKSAVSSADSHEIASSNSASASCRPVYRKLDMKISEQCQKFSYQFVECKGFCHSGSMVWKNSDGIQSTACCSLQSVSQKSAKIFCLKPVEMNEVRNELYSRIKDFEMLRLFQNSFSKSKWTEQIMYKGKIMYTGFYKIVAYFNATCECETI